MKAGLTPMLRLCGLLPVFAGLPAMAGTQFDVASVKVNSGGQPGSRFTAAHGTLTGANVTLKLLIGAAYGVQAFEISGAPAWVNTERFDIQAKTGGDATREEMMPMLRALLEDRFRLKAHRETKEGPIFTLAVAKGGPKFRPFQGAACVPPCGFIQAGANGLNRTMDGPGTGMDIWARTLTLILAKPVYDRTGLTGRFDAMHLEYAPDDRPDAPGPSIFTALQEQLGLKLEAGRGTVDSLAIDRIEKPSGN